MILFSVNVTLSTKYFYIITLKNYVKSKNPFSEAKYKKMLFYDESQQETLLRHSQ